MISWFEAIVLGIVQGLTEFLPISSSAHVLIVSQLFGWEDPGAAFTAVTQIGTETAVILYFRKDIWRIISTWTRSLVTGGAAQQHRRENGLVRHHRNHPDRQFWDSRSRTRSKPWPATCGWSPAP